MTATDPDTEALETWRAERREHLAVNSSLTGLKFASPGALDRDLTAWATAMADGHQRNVILAGPVGTGKTWAVWHAAEHAVRCGSESRDQRYGAGQGGRWPAAAAAAAAARVMGAGGRAEAVAAGARRPLAAPNVLDGR